MPRPLTERQALEQERAELLGQIAAYWQELENGSPHRAQRERLDWQIRNAENRLAEIKVRLAALQKMEEPGGAASRGRLIPFGRSHQSLGCSHWAGRHFGMGKAVSLRRWPDRSNLIT